jgi:hypothetical protein
VAVGVCGGSGQHRRLRVGRAHGQVRGWGGLQRSQRWVLQRRHGGGTIGGRGDWRMGRLRRVRVAVVAVHGRRILAATALERRQRGQLVLGAVELLADGRVVA